MITLNPDDFNLALEPQDTSAINKAILEKLKNFDMWATQPQFIRDERKAGRGTFPASPKSERAEIIQIDTPAGKLTLRLISPENPRGVYLHIHGGGWVLGGSDQQDVMLENIVLATNLAVVSVEYRLAPEYPYPAANNDCEWAALWLVKEGYKRFNTKEFYIGGESAGAHLSVITMLRLRDKHELTPFKGANLNAGVFDLALTPSVRKSHEKLILNHRDIEMFVRHYTLHGGALDNPDISPLHADLRGLPPALFTIGTKDPLLDDSLFMSARWLAAGNKAELAVYNGGCHVFLAFPSTHSTAASARIAAFLGN